MNAYEILVHAPDGGFYLFPDFSALKTKLHANGIKTSNELCQQLLKDTGVAILPASAFGFDQNYLAARLAYVDFQNLKNGSAFDVKVNCPNVIKGIDKLCEWISNL